MARLAAGRDLKLGSEEKNPIGLRIFFGTTPVLPLRARRVLYIVALGLFFEAYDMALLNSALPQISADLGIGAGDSGFYLGAIRLGGIGTFLLLPLADRLGRRRLFMFAFVGMSVGTLASGLSPNAAFFACTQFLTRIFMLLGAALSVVIVVEEFPAEFRGAGVGALAVIGGMGFGLCAMLYSVVDFLPFGWRALYLLGFAPIFSLPFVRKRLKETRRFQALDHVKKNFARAQRLRQWIDPIRTLVREHPRQLLAVGTCAFLTSLGSIGFFQYTSYVVQELHGWPPAGYSMLVLLGGMIGVAGNFLGGRGSDRFGRRLIGSLTLLAAPFLMLAFFQVGPLLLIPTWGAVVFCTSAGDIVLRALSIEIFPTAQRSSSSGWMLGIQTLGWTTGLFAVGFITDSIDDLTWALPLVGIGLGLGGLALLALPETRGLELEAISEKPGTSRSQAQVESV